MTDMQWSTPLSDDEVSALAGADPYLAGGDAEAWDEGVTYLYIFDEPTLLNDLTFPPGQYIRHVWQKKELGWLVTGDAEEHVQAIEDRWIEYDNATADPCDECGAAAHEKCRVPNCQGTWR